MHREGVVHRDIKPENPLWDDQAKRLLSIDFSARGAYTAGYCLLGFPFFAQAQGPPAVPEVEQGGGNRAAVLVLLEMFADAVGSALPRAVEAALAAVGAKPTGLRADAVLELIYEFGLYVGLAKQGRVGDMSTQFSLAHDARAWSEKTAKVILERVRPELPHLPPAETEVSATETLLTTVPSEPSEEARFFTALAGQLREGLKTVGNPAGPPAADGGAGSVSAPRPAGAERG